jgi:hypothetical protein
VSIGDLGCKTYGMLMRHDRHQDLPVFGSEGEQIPQFHLWALNICVFQPYEWRGLRQTRGLRSKARRVLSQFSPHDWTSFKWEGTTSFLHYLIVVLLLAVFLAAELNPFYLKVSILTRRLTLLRFSRKS